MTKTKRTTTKKTTVKKTVYFELKLVCAFVVIIRTLQKLAWHPVCVIHMYCTNFFIHLFV